MGSAAPAQEVAPDEAYELREAVATRPSALSDDGTVQIHVIRPGIGRGRGRHLYEADMLERHAKVFTGWRMYVDHLAPEARKAAGGLPRKARDLGGRIEESWWDATVPADPEKGWGQGAVVARARPVLLARELIEQDPEIVEASISASATGVKAVERGGKRAWLVEGINPQGSVDWVTEAGAGGRVVPIIESVHRAEQEEEVALLESLDDDALTKYLTEERPHLLETAAAPESRNNEEDEVAEITPEALREALQSDETKQMLGDLVEARVDERIEEERDIIRAEARADAGRELQLHKFEREAHRLIDEAKLPDALAKESKSRFLLTEAGPTRSLDLLDEVDGDGELVESAEAKLQSAVKDEVKRQRDMLAEVLPTRVRGQGAGGAEGGDTPDLKPKGTYWGDFLQEAGIDPEKAYPIGGSAVAEPEPEPAQAE